MMEAKPFVKWVGGKRQLITKLIHFSPAKFENYHEPFLGGGILFLKLSVLGKIKHAFLNDVNETLMDSYKTIKKKPKELINELKKPKYQNNKENFLKIRAENPVDLVEKTARFIYLNKTAFNGLYRVNLKGDFNVPFGKYKNPKILDEKNILAVSNALQKDELSSLDFEKALHSVKKNDFIYFDPPYQPISKTASFTNYTKESFTEKDQKRLAKKFNELDRKGCYVMLSNSYSPLIFDLYKGHNFHVIKANRVINCKAEGRGKIKELIITNY
ncbi:MAG: DNA adenine methylase [archaeon]